GHPAACAGSRGRGQAGRRRPGWQATGPLDASSSAALAGPAAAEGRARAGRIMTCTMSSDLPIPLLPQLLGRRVVEAQDRADRIYEPVIGLVVDNKDPDKLGRVKVRFPTLPGQDSSWWAPIAALGAG